MWCVQELQPEVLYEDRSVTLNLISALTMTSISNGRHSSVLVVIEEAWQVNKLCNVLPYMVVLAQSNQSCDPHVCYIHCTVVRCYWWSNEAACYSSM